MIFYGCNYAIVDCGISRYSMKLKLKMQLGRHVDSYTFDRALRANT